MAGVIAALDLGVPFTHFGGTEASIVLVVITLLAWVGFHPVILVSVVGPWLAPLDPEPNLLAMTFSHDLGHRPGRLSHVQHHAGDAGPVSGAVPGAAAQ